MGLGDLLSITIRLKGQSIVNKASVVVDRLDHKMTYWPHFLFDVDKQKHNTKYRGTASLGLHKQTVLELCLVINEKSQRQYMEQTAGKRSL